MYEKEIESKMRKLPDEVRREVLDYIEFLLSKYRHKKGVGKKFKFDWEGGIAELKEKFTSIELQHKALEWR
ncbi:MAG: XRE family transcriptional regulator [candidate division Zixibacteria bacterium SM1_73]|nr:MAG: XRE family transcriptional regulator [candidate division Zixibacteria bacterium SM1_73]